MAAELGCGLSPDAEVPLRHVNATSQGTAVLVVSKPYQLLMGLSALEQEDREAHLMVMSAGFHNPGAFLRLLDGHTVLERIRSCHEIPDYQSLEQYSELIRGADLLVEDDRVSLYRLFKSLQPNSLSVIEEGIGTYISHYWQRTHTLRGRLKAVKWLVLCSLTGCGLKIGGGRHTGAVYCVKPALFARLNPEIGHKARRIEGLGLFRQHFARHLQNCMPGTPGGAATLALLGWYPPTDEQLRTWVAGADTFYYKPHPHRPDPLGEFGEGIKLPDAIPAEFLIDFLANRHDELDVYHSASSACVFYPFEKPSGLRFHPTTVRWFDHRLEAAMKAVTAKAETPAHVHPNLRLASVVEADPKRPS